jgi:hypothetical protein
MKLNYIFFFGLLLTASCENTETDKVDSEKQSSEDVSSADGDLTASEKISKRWVLVKRTTINKDKVIEFNEKNSSVITFFEDNGYFRIYDSLTTQDKTNGVREIEQRKSGQWEVLEDKLILRYTQPDTVTIEEHLIQKLDDSELILKSEEKNQINIYNIKSN